MRKAVVVSDDPKIGLAFRRALAIPTDVRRQHHVDVLPMNRVAEIDWENTGLLIWQGTLPSGLVAEQIQHFVNNGRVAMFFPSKLQTLTATGEQLSCCALGELAIYYG